MEEERVRDLMGRLIAAPPSRPVPRALAQRLMARARRAQDRESAASDRNAPH